MKLEACWLIQITLADIQRKHNAFVEEIATLGLKSQKSELAATKSEMEKVKKEIQDCKTNSRMWW